MKILKIFLTIFLVGFLLFGFLCVYNGFQYSKKKEIWQAEKDRLNISIANHQIDAKFYAEEAEKWLDAAKAEETKRKDIEKQLEAEKVAHARDLARIETLAPDEIVVETRYALQVDEAQVYLVPDGVQFTLAASRLNLQKLHSLDFTLNIEIPRLKELITSRDTEIISLKGVIFNKDGTISTVEGERDDWKEKFKGEEKLRKDSERSVRLFSTKNLIVGGVVVAVIACLSFILR